MAGIYIHIPFCRQKCHYCNFFSLVSKKQINEFEKALIGEIEARANYLEGEFIRTIYIGGGTPSILGAGTIQSIMGKIYNLFNIDKDVEITLEANPDDINHEYLVELKRAGINRLSIGVQSFHDNDLLFLNRVHNGKQAVDAIQESLETGFKNLSIDLIFGIPGLTEDGWKDNLARAIHLKIPHISAYALTVEEKTPLEWLIRQGKLPAIDEDQSSRQFEMAMEILQDNNYEHYEISNYCLPGHYSKHNTAYWRGEKYMGLGPSAHSFDKISRQWNIANLRLYLDAIQKGQLPFEKEVLSEEQKFNEYIMTSIRSMWGTNLKFLKKNFNPEWEQDITRQMQPFLALDWLEIKNETLILTSKGKLFADRVASSLFRG